MFLFKDYANKEVTPAPRPIICTDRRFVFNQPLTLYLNEKLSFSGDDFTIKDSNGVSYFKCKGKNFSIRDKKVIYDLYDKPIFNIRANAFIGHGQKIYAEKSTDKILGSVHRRSLLKKNKYEFSYVNLETGQNEILDLKCDLIGCTCGIFCGKEKEGAPMICSINKPMDVKNFISSRDHYVIKIAPGVDAALMVALAIIFDELKNEEE